MNSLCKILLCVSLIFNFQLSTLNLHAQDTIRLSLDSCLRYAYKNNLTVQSAQLGHENANVSLTGARLRFMPFIGASASQGWDWSSNIGSGSSTNYGINGSLTLFSGLANLRNLQQSKVAATQSELRIRQTENSIGVQIVQAYLTILMNEERLLFQQDVLETSRQQKLEGEVKHRVGRILESDYLLLAANYISAQNEVENTRITISNDINTLNDLLFTTDDTRIATIPLEDTIRAADRTLLAFDSILALAKLAMPDWQISEMNVEMAKLNVDMARSSFIPTVSLNAGYGGGWIPALTESSSKFSDNSSLSIGVNIPILNSGSSYTQLKHSKIALQQAELQHQQALIDIVAQVENVYIAACQALNRYRASEALVEAYKANYDIYVIKYGEGAVTTVDMLQQQDRYLSALNDYLQNKYTFILANKQLDIYTGKL